MTEQKKPPKVRPPWVDCLMDEIKAEKDKAISGSYETFCKTRILWEAKEITEQEVRQLLDQVKADVIQKAEYKHHADKLLSATIDYIIDPNRKVKLLT